MGFMPVAAAVIMASAVVSGGAVSAQKASDLIIETGGGLGHSRLLAKDRRTTRL